MLHSSCEELNDVLPTLLSDEQRIQGLKETLIVSSDSASGRVSKVNGYFQDAAIKILLPKEVQDVTLALSFLGLGSVVNNLEEAMNRSAEVAAKQATPIFTGAITRMSIADAAGIIAGSDTAATNYLRLQTTTELTATYRPIVDSVMKLPLVAGISAAGAWNTLTTTYNFANPNNKINTDLTAHITNRALHGLYLKLGEQEKRIRNNPQEQVTEAIRRIFSDNTQ